MFVIEGAIIDIRLKFESRQKRLVNNLTEYT